MKFKQGCLVLLESEKDVYFDCKDILHRLGIAKGIFEENSKLYYYHVSDVSK